MHTYPEAIAALTAEPRQLPLGPGTPNHAARPALQALTLESAFAPHPIQNRDAAHAVLAGLWLYHDFLDESHTTSQDLQTPEGSYWHAIMHRREPDAWNSKYWWRKVGAHPVINSLAEQAREMGYKYTNPQDFVDFCEKVRDSGSADEDLAKRVQLLEWQLLFDHCYRQSIS